MTDNEAAEQEKHMKQLKRKMECWREVILPLYSVLLWERSWYPGLIFGFVTTIFCTIWILELSLLAIVCISLSIVALIDYLVPVLTSLLCNAQSWTGQKEKKLIEICQNLSTTMAQIENIWTSAAKIRIDRPSIYYSVTISCLLLFAWISSTINNLLLFYIIVNAILLTPGVRHKGRARWAIILAYDRLIRRHLP
ncbi:ADP-ribosylation factor-like protein 6-interacting protein 1 [Harpegnathos saltator]|uniref:ADP-ribosylation factor-like protein 6-interacting protein 1 n=1 Tax=Harpegnathos saltator TaxID=610380 RepID=E2BUS0_HARSA|nr:ADP-ribosylation factor-like protein 6-interacting protein 1 [Harpegnathos saltator]EFN80543.1 ADP-ribosylation factor-like protein 6-interacting protein 1 [Harpegnathos saltator]